MTTTHRRRVALLLTMTQRFWYQLAQITFNDLPDGALASGTYQAEIGKYIVTATSNSPVVASGKLSFTGATGNRRTLNVTNIQDGGFTQSTGTCLVFDLSGTSGSQVSFGLGNTNAAFNTSSDVITYRLNATTGNMAIIKPAGVATTLGTYNAANTQRLYIVTFGSAATGNTSACYLFRRDATDGIVRLEAIQGAFVANVTRYPFLSVNNSAVTIDNIRLVQLLAPYNTANCLLLTSTTHADGALVAEALADGFFKWDAMLAVGETANFFMRYTDDDNAIIFRISETGNTVKIICKEAGAEDELASLSTTVADGTLTLRVQLYGSLIQAWYANTRVGQVTESFNVAVSGGKVDVTSGADLQAYPATITGTFLAQLESAGLA